MLRRLHEPLAVVTVFLDGEPLSLPAGETVGAAPPAAGITVCRTAPRHGGADCELTIIGGGPAGIAAGTPGVGPSAEAPGLWHALGYSGHWCQLSPIVGTLLAGLIVDGRSALPPEAFRAGRFNEGPVTAHPVVAS